MGSLWVGKEIRRKERKEKEKEKKRKKKENKAIVSALKWAFSV